MPSPSYRTILRYYWMQMRNHRGYFYLVFFAYAVGVVGDSVLLPLIIQRIIDIVSKTSDYSAAWTALLHLLTQLAVLMITYNIAFRVGDFATSRFQYRTMKDLVDFAFEKLTSHSYRFFSNSFSGSLVTKVKRFVRSFEDGTDNIFFSFWITAVQLVGALLTLFIVAPLLGWMFFIWSILYLGIAYYLTKKKIPYDLAESNADSKVTGRLADVITNILNLKIFSSRAKEIIGFEEVSTKEREARRQAWNFGNYINLFQAILFATVEFAGFVVALYLWREGVISAGTIVLFQLFIWSMGHNLWNLSKAMGKVSKNFADASELVEIMETPIDIKDPKRPELSRMVHGAIAFKDVSFKYGKKANHVFENFTLRIPAGQRVGLVGHSGAGKTTITKLLLRFADIQHGAILIDGQDITAVTQDDLRSAIAYVPQDPILFHRSLRENIAYGRPDATEEEIMDASRKAHAHEFISKFPEGYETLVGERGVKLSGGERQRVAIARAMLKKAPLLILDEATSSLDAVSEGYIQEAFKELMKGRTTIVIAHRLSTIQGLDRIIVLKDGAIAEEGTHAELLAEKGIYQNFWEHQTAGFIK